MSMIMRSAKFGIGSAAGRDVYKEIKEVGFSNIMLILIFFGVILLGVYIFFYAITTTWNIFSKGSSLIKRLLSLPVAIILTPIGTLVTVAGLSLLVYVVGGLLYLILSAIGYNVDPTYTTAKALLVASYSYLSESMLVNYLANQLEGLFLLLAPASTDVSSEASREFLKISSMSYLFITLPTLVFSLIFSRGFNEESNEVFDD